MTADSKIRNYCYIIKNFSSTQLFQEKQVGHKHNLFLFPANVVSVKDNTMLSIAVQFTSQKTKLSDACFCHAQLTSEDSPVPGKRSPADE